MTISLRIYIDVPSNRILIFFDCCFLSFWIIFSISAFFLLSSLEERVRALPAFGRPRHMARTVERFQVSMISLLRC